MVMHSGGERLSFTRDKVEELLRPELEDGTITWNDFERTKRFASVNRTYWPAVTGTLSAASIIYYGHWYRRRPWSKPSFLLIVPVAYALGTFPGALAQILAVRRFRRDLEDPTGLLEALARRIRLVPHTAHESNVTQEESDPSSSKEPDNTSQSDDRDATTGRWAEIRTASNSASTSTWDHIRQAHERRKESQPAADVDDRQAEKAKFDALLEAERKMSS